MANQVYLDPAGFVRQIYTGDQDVMTISQIIKQTMVVIRDLQAGHPEKPINFLVNMSNIGNQDLSARRAGGKALKSLPYNKIAIFGLNSFMRHVANLVITASHKQMQVKQFRDEATAIAWLQE